MIFAAQLPEWVNESMFKWVTNNGLAVVFVVLLLALVVSPLFLLLRYVIFDAVRYFTARLDSMARSQARSTERLADAIAGLAQETRQSREQNVLNHEALSGIMLFMSRTQQDVVLTKKAVEATQQDVVATKKIIEQAPESP
jgi:Mg2+/Co2+ transporter CorB